LNCKEDDVLGVENKLLEDIQFDTRVFHPQSCVDAIMSDFAAVSSMESCSVIGVDDVDAPVALARTGMSPAGKAQQREAIALIETLMQSLACLRFSPFEIALSVLSHSAQANESFPPYVYKRFGAVYVDSFESVRRNVTEMLTETQVDSSVCMLSS
jgi:hypothetical protein